jgi:hypothetical protein
MRRLSVTGVEQPLSPLWASSNGLHGQVRFAFKFLESDFIVHPPFWESITLSWSQPPPLGIKLSLALSYRQELLPCTTPHAAAINPRKHDRAASPAVNPEFDALALMLLNTTCLSLTCELPQLSLGRQMA